MTALLDPLVLERESQPDSEDVEVYLQRNLITYSDQIKMIPDIFRTVGIKFNIDKIDSAILLAYQYGEALLYKGRLAKELANQLSLKKIPCRLNPPL
jgi:hypothetical protein